MGGEYYTKTTKKLCLWHTEHGKATHGNALVEFFKSLFVRLRGATLSEDTVTWLHTLRNARRAHARSLLLVFRILA